MRFRKNFEYIDNLGSGDNVIWETHRVALTKVPVFGFGIAVSGGVDSPHFASGDPSVAISDVLKAGPAEGKLQVNDRIISVNGVSLENVNHTFAISMLRDNGNTVNLVVRRRIVLPQALETDTPPLKVTLSRRNKKDDFGVVIGCKFFVKEVQPHSLAAHEGALREGDTILKINNSPIDNLSLSDAKKLIEKTKDKLQLIVTKKRVPDDRHKRQNSQLKEEDILAGYSTLRRQQDKNDVNIYRPSVRSEDEVYKPSPLPHETGVPHGAYPNSEHVRYDGRYVLDNDAPPRPPLPPGFSEVSPSSQSPVHAQDGYHRADPHDGYYSDREAHPRRETRLDDDRRVPAMPEDDDVFAGPRHEERYVGLRKDVQPEPRTVRFIKDKMFGLGLSLAGGNATGIFIASVQPNSAAEREGLCEGDQILQANEQVITGLTREDAVAYLKSMEGQVAITVQYRKEEYDRIMTSNEAGDSFYVKAHFNFEPQEAGDHGFTCGDIFHVKDTLFRRENETWLAVKLGKNNQESKKGTIPNRKRAETLAQTQQQSSSEKENFPNKGRGSLFKRKAARRAKSLGKDHWEEVIFSNDAAGLSTKFPAYERVMLSEVSFVRPVVIFGGIADIARDRLLADFPDKFESPQSESGPDEEKKMKSGIIRLGAIREAMSKRKHCLLDVTPHHVDRLNYAQYYPIVIYLKCETKQAIKDIRGRWKAASKNPKKVIEHNEKLEKMYSHLFTGTISHNSSDMWYGRLCDLVSQQQRQHVWMSEMKPEEDISEDFLFPMPARMSYASPESDFEGHRPYDDFDVSPIQKKRLVRSSSDPSVNTADHGIPGIPPYPAPPSYHQKYSTHDRYMRGSDPRDGMWPRENEWHGQTSEDHYYPSYYAESQPGPHHSRSNIDPYATLTPSERLRNRIASDQQYHSSREDYSPHRGGSDDMYRAEPSPGKQMSPHHAPHMAGQGVPHDPRMPHNDSSSHSSDSYSKYVNHPSNKHDDTKLREKFGGVTGRERSPGHDPYRFTRSTANPVKTSNVNKATISDLTAKYRKEEVRGSPQGRADTLPAHGGHKKRKEPPPVPVKTFSLKDRGSDVDEQKIRNYENSNRHYNYADVSPHRTAPTTTDRYIPPDQDQYPANHILPDSLPDTPYEYIAVRGQPAQRDLRHRSDPHQPQHSDHYDDRYRDNPYDPNAKAFANQMYMDHRDVERMRVAKHSGKSPGSERDLYSSPESGYTRPR